MDEPSQNEAVHAAFWRRVAGRLIPMPSARGDVPPARWSPPSHRRNGEAQDHPRPLRVLMVSAKSGGGHDGTARALEHWLRQAVAGPVQVQCLDVYDRKLRALPWLARIRQHSDFIWKAFFALTEQPWALALARRALQGPLTRSVMARIEQAPDLLVATHFAGAQILPSLARRLPGHPPTLVVATDYRPHRAWFAPASMVMVSQSHGLARAQRFAGEHQAICTAPLLPCLPPPRSDGARANGAPHGEPRDEPHGKRLRVLAVMGADGTSGRRLIRLLLALARRPWSHRLEVEVVCGRNHRLQQQLAQALAGAGIGPEQPAGHCMRVEITGFATDLPARIAQADLCLLRASPLVLTEVLAAGVPALAFDWHPHEAANAELLEQWGCGHASRSVEVLAGILETWAAPTGRLDAAREATQRVARQAFGAAQMRPILDRLFGPRGAA